MTYEERTANNAYAIERRNARILRDEGRVVEPRVALSAEDRAEWHREKSRRGMAKFNEKQIALADATVENSGILLDLMGQIQTDERLAHWPELRGHILAPVHDAYLRVPQIARNEADTQIDKGITKMLAETGKDNVTDLVAVLADRVRCLNLEDEAAA